MRVATYAKQIGRTVAFALAAYRQAFAGGRSLAEPDNVVIAAAACEMHPAAVLKAAELRGVGDEARRGDRARDRARRARRAGRVGRRARGRRVMRAKGRYRLVVRRGGLAPVVLAAPERVDHVEIIDIDEGETVLYWDLLPRDAKRVVTMLRADLETMEAREFFERWARSRATPTCRHLQRSTLRRGRLAVSRAILEQGRARRRRWLVGPPESRARPTQRDVAGELASIARRARPTPVRYGSSRGSVEPRAGPAATLR